MPYNLLLLPLLGGFLFFHLTYFFRFAAQRLDGYRLLFQSAIAGTFLSILARLIVLAIAASPAGPSAESYWTRFSPFPYSATSALSLVLGPLVAVLINFVLGKEKAIDMEIRRHANSLTKLLHRAQRENLLVSVTLDSRKWYVGWVAETPNLDPQELYFRILPFMSGYRDPEKLEVHRTVFYQDVLADQKLDPGQFFLTLALKDVKIAGLFNQDVFNEYFAAPEEDAQESPAPTAAGESD
jgi:hypothetical protein